MRIIINMAEKEFKPVSSRTENIIKGLFTILLSVVVSINVGKIGRTLSFPLLYFLGAAYYLLIAFAIFAGGYRLVKKQKLKITDFKIVIGIILALLGFVIIISYISFFFASFIFCSIVLFLVKDYQLLFRKFWFE